MIVTSVRMESGQCHECKRQAERWYGQHRYFQGTSDNVFIFGRCKYHRISSKVIGKPGDPELCWEVSEEEVAVYQVHMS